MGDSYEARTDYLPYVFASTTTANKLQELLTRRATEGWYTIGSLVSAASNRLYVVFERPLPAAGPERGAGTGE